MARRSDLSAQVKDLQAKLAASQATITTVTADLAAARSGLAAAVMDKANLEVELTIEREANSTLSEQGVQLRADLAAATAEITRLTAIIDADPASANLNDQLQQLD